MTRSRAAALIAASLVALAAPATSVSAPTYEYVGELQVEQTRALILGAYGEVWQTVHPRYRRVTTRAFWQGCQRKRARTTAGVKVDWRSVKATGENADRITLPLLGSIPVVAVNVEAKAKLLGKTQTVRGTNYWTQPNRNANWFAVWDRETYRAYKAHRCPAQPDHPSPPLFG